VHAPAVPLAEIARAQARLALREELRAGGVAFGRRNVAAVGPDREITSSEVWAYGAFAIIP
jgi:hypothetical protein